VKRWKTTDIGPLAVKRGTCNSTLQAARETLRERNGGLPPNLHLCSRLVLLKLISELHQQLTDAKKQAEQQADLNSQGSDREAKLLARVRELERRLIP
jgi:multidrug efflux pump subunit AcrA (membrane-fusion protein)